MRAARRGGVSYSFVAGEEGGTFAFPPTQPGGGGKNLRRQFQILKQFVEGFDFLKMAPDHDIIVGCTPEGTVARALSQPGKAYAVYVSGGSQVDLTLGLPDGQYKAEWLNPRTANIEARQTVKHTGGTAQLRSPAYTEDIALRIVREDA